MRLITENGQRIDRHAELAGMMTHLKVTPFHHVTLKDRQRLRSLLDLQYLQRASADKSRPFEGGEVWHMAAHIKPTRPWQHVTKALDSGEMGRPLESMAVPSVTTRKTQGTMRAGPSQR